MTHCRTPSWRCSQRFVRWCVWPLSISLIAAVEVLAAVAEPKRQFDISGSAAEAALQAFVEQARIDLVYNIDKIEGVRTNPIKGRMTVGEALRRLVANTGLVIVKDEKSGALILDRAPPAPPPDRPATSVKKNETQTPQNQQPMKRNNLLVKLAATLALMFASAGSADAQTAPALDNDSNTKEQAVELSPFVVRSDQDVGYLAGNTLAGSRFNTALKDTPASISVMTSEFLADIGAFQIEEALEYAVNLEFDQDDDREGVNGNANMFTYQTYRVRGLPASRSRNYFPWGTEATIPDETAFLDRIEDSRGPNSVLFGVGSPGGVINSSTKQPQFGRAFQKGSFTIGRFDSKRVALDFNQPMLDGKLAVRLNLVYNKNNTFRHYEFQEHQRALLSALYKVAPQTRLRVEFERGQLASNKGRSYNLRNQFLNWDSNGRPTFATQTANAALGVTRLNANNARVTYFNNNGAVIDMKGALRTNGSTVPDQLAPDGRPIAGGVIIDQSISDYSINVGGPAQNRYTRYGIFSAFMEHQFTKNTFLELAYNHLDNSRDTRDPRGEKSNLIGDPNQQLAGATNPFAGQVYLETQWWRATHWTRSDAGRVTLSHELNAGKWGNYRFAALGQYDKFFSEIHSYHENWIDPNTGSFGIYHATPDNALNRVTRRSYPVEGDWGTYYIAGPQKSGGLLSNVTDPVTGRTLASAWVPAGAPSELYWTQKAGMVVMQGKYFKGRLVTAAGLRRDEITESRLRDTRDPNTGIRVLTREFNESQRNENVGRTKTFGVVYHLTPAVSLIYNQADNVSLPGRGRQTLPSSGEPGDPRGVPPPTGKGEDFGIGLTLLEGRIYAKAVAYTTSMVSDSTTAPSQTRNANARIMDTLLARDDITQADYDSRVGHAAHGSHGLFDFDSEGYEFQITANATKNWRFVVNYAKAEAVQSNTFAAWGKWLELTEAYLTKFDSSIATSSGDTIAEEIQIMRDEMQNFTSGDGIGKLGNRHHKVSLFTRYNFSSGWLKGAYIGGGYRHQSKMFVGVDAAGDKLWGNSYWQADAMAGYTVRGLRNGRRMSFQLNISNVFNEREPLVTRYQDNGSVNFHVIQAPATWRFTTNFEY